MTRASTTTRWNCSVISFIFLIHLLHIVLLKCSFGHWQVLGVDEYAPLEEIKKAKDRVAKCLGSVRRFALRRRTRNSRYCIIPTRHLA